MWPCRGFRRCGIAPLCAADRSALRRRLPPPSRTRALTTSRRRSRACAAPTRPSRSRLRSCTSRTSSRFTTPSCGRCSTSGSAVLMAAALWHSGSSDVSFPPAALDSRRPAFPPEGGGAGGSREARQPFRTAGGRGDRRPHYCMSAARRATSSASWPATGRVCFLPPAELMSRKVVASGRSRASRSRCRRPAVRV